MRSVNLQVHTDDIQTAAMNDLLSLVCETYQVSACLRFLCSRIHSIKTRRNSIH